MDILEQLGTKVKNAVQKIEELQARVTELEEINAQYEQKMKDMLDVMEPLDETKTQQEQEPAATSFGVQQEERSDIYKQQY